jgi:hypothetical protein
MSRPRRAGEGRAQRGKPAPPHPPARIAHPTSANIQWRDVEARLKALGAEIEEREGSRVAVIMFGEV